MSRLDRAENFENYCILHRYDYTKTKADFLKFAHTLLGYCPAEITVTDAVLTTWYNYCLLPTDALELDTHPTLPDEVSCVFQVLDWEAIFKHIGDKGALTLVDPFAGIDDNILTQLQMLFLEHHPTLHQVVKCINNDKKITGIDSLNPYQNMHLRDGKCPRIYVFSGPYSINDLCITYFEHFNNFILVAQVRDSFLSRNEVAYRTEGWFKKLWEEERVLIIEGGFASEGGLPYRKNEGQQKWLIIFANKKYVTCFIKPTRKYRISGWPVMEQFHPTTLMKKRARDNKKVEASSAMLSVDHCLHKVPHFLVYVLF